MRGGRLLLATVALILMPVLVQATPIFFGTCKVTFGQGSLDGVGIGGKFDVGIPLGNNLIWRGTYDAYKTAEGTGYDNGFTGLTAISGPFWSKLKMGVYLTAEGGVSKVSGEDVQLATLSSMGAYFDVTSTTNLWLGTGYSTVANEGQVWSVTFGLSIDVSFK